MPDVESLVQVFESVLRVLSGCKDSERGKLLKSMFQTRYFRIVVVEDEQTVEVCGALKVQTLCLWREREKHTLRLWREKEKSAPIQKKICPGIFTVVVLFC